MKTKKTTLLLFLAGILAMSVNPGHAQSLCDPDFWRAAQAEDIAEDIDQIIDQINEINVPHASTCKNHDYETVGMPIFHVAAVYASPEVVHIIVDAGADPDIKNHNGNTVLHGTVFIGDSEAAQTLVDAGADPDIKNYNGNTALHGAAIGGNSEAVQILVDADADLNIENNDGETALMIAVERGRSDIAQILVDAGAKKGGLIKQWRLYKLLQ